MEKYLNMHDQEESTVKHQGMVIAQTKEDLNSARKFCRLYNVLYPYTPITQYKRRSQAFNVMYRAIIESKLPS